MPRSALLLILSLGLLFAVAVQASSSGDGSESSTISPASTCYIRQECSGGGVVECTGPSGTCKSGSYWVECGGVRHECCEPYCEPCEVTVTCAYGGFISCNSSQTPRYHYCEKGSDYVYCEGVGYLFCDQCEPRFWCTAP